MGLLRLIEDPGIIHKKETAKKEGSQKEPSLKVSFYRHVSA